MNFSDTYIHIFVPYPPCDQIPSNWNGITTTQMIDGHIEYEIYIILWLSEKLIEQDNEYTLFLPCEYTK